MIELPMIELRGVLGFGDALALLAVAAASVTVLITRQNASPTDRATQMLRDATRNRDMSPPLRSIPSDSRAAKRIAAP
jgi:hypothetical protein